MYEDDEYTAEYLRLVPSKSKVKCYKLKSKLYSASATVMACTNARYKVFVLSSEEYDNLMKSKKASPQDINLDIYIKLFFANMATH